MASMDGLMVMIPGWRAIDRDRSDVADKIKSELVVKRGIERGE